MPQTNDIAGLVIFDTNELGHATDMSFASTPFDTTTLRYAAGAVARDRALSDVYTNTGTPTSPVWTKVPKKSSSISRTIAGAVTLPLFGVGATPVGFSGTIVAVRVVNGDATKGTLIFSKNGINFCTLIKNGTAGAMTGSPLGTATADGSPVGNITFSASDVMSVQNVGTDFAEVIVDFI